MKQLAFRLTYLWHNKNKRTTAFQGEKHSITQMTKAAHLLIFYQHYEEIWSTMRSRMPWHLCSNINYSWLHFQSSIIHQCFNNKARGVLTVLVTKTSTMKPDEGTLAVRFMLEEEKNRPSGQCAVELSPAVWSGIKGLTETLAYSPCAYIIQQLVTTVCSLILRRETSVVNSREGKARDK